MDKENINYLYTWFDYYVSSFSSKDPLVVQNLKVKADHTKRVCNIMKELSSSLNLTENQQLLSEAIALLHDVGRFQQFVTYKTYSDFKSINHAELGLTVLEEEDLLGFLSLKEKEYLYAAIKYHNAKCIPDTIDPETFLYCALIRDADKLDIFYVISSYEKDKATSPNAALDELPKEQTCSKDIYNALMKKERVDYEMIRNSYDRRLLELGWVLDFNFNFTFKYYMEKNYLDIFYSFLPKTYELDLLYKKLFKFIEEKLSSLN